MSASLCSTFPSTNPYSKPSNIDINDEGGDSKINPTISPSPPAKITTEGTENSSAPNSGRSTPVDDGNKADHDIYTVFRILDDPEQTARPDNAGNSLELATKRLNASNRQSISSVNASWGSEHVWPKGMNSSPASLSSDVTVFDNTPSEETREIRKLIDELNLQLVNKRIKSRTTTFTSARDAARLATQETQQPTETDALNKLKQIKEVCSQMELPETFRAKVLLTLASTQKQVDRTSDYRQELFDWVAEVLDELSQAIAKHDFEINSSSGYPTTCVQHLYSLLSAYPGLEPDRKFALLDTLASNENLDTKFGQKVAYVILEEIDKTHDAMKERKAQETKDGSSLPAPGAELYAGLMTSRQIEDLHDKLPDLTPIMEARLRSLAENAEGCLISEEKIDRRLRQLLAQVERPPRPRLYITLDQLQNQLPKVTGEEKYRLLLNLFAIRNSFTDSRFYEKIALYFDNIIFLCHEKGLSGMDNDAVDELKDGWDIEFTNINDTLKELLRESKSSDAKSIFNIRRTIGRLHAFLKMTSINFADREMAKCVGQLKDFALKPYINDGETVEILHLMSGLRDRIKNQDDRLSAFAAILEVLCKKNATTGDRISDTNPKASKLLVKEAGRLDHLLGSPLELSDWPEQFSNEAELKKTTEKRRFILKLPFVSGIKTVPQTPEQTIGSSVLGTIVGTAIAKLGSTQCDNIKQTWADQHVPPADLTDFFDTWKPTAKPKLKMRSPNLLRALFNRNINKKSEDVSLPVPNVRRGQRSDSLPEDIRENRSNTLVHLETNDGNEVADDGYGDFLAELLAGHLQSVSSGENPPDDVGDRILNQANQ